MKTIIWVARWCLAGPLLVIASIVFVIPFVVSLLVAIVCVAAVLIAGVLCVAIGLPALTICGGTEPISTAWKETKAEISPND